MQNKYTKVLIVTSIVTLLPIIVGLIFWNALPNELPTHFDADGTANDYSSKPFAVFGLPLILLGIHLICFFSALTDPKKANYSKFMLLILLWSTPIVSLICGFTIYAKTFGLSFNIAVIIQIFIGLLFAAFGFFLPKCKRNYTMGIKLPWTLNSDENWEKTHHIAGIVYKTGGIAIIATSFLSNIRVFIPILILTALLPAAYSFVYYRRFEKR